MKIDLKKVGERLKRVRGKLTLDEFGKIIGISRSMVSKYENGDAWPKPDILGKIAEYGNTSFDWLLIGLEPSKTPELEPITYQLGEKEERGLHAAEDLLEHYGLDKRFRVTEVHRPPPPAETISPDIQEIINIVTALDPEYRADLLKAAREKKIIYELTLKKDVVKAIEEEKLKELKEADNLLADLAGGKPIAEGPKDRQHVEKSHQVNDSTESL